MDYRKAEGTEKRREGQDDRMGRMRCFPGRPLVPNRNPVHPVHPVRKALSGKVVASSGLDGVSAHREGGLAPIRGSMRNLLTYKAGFTQVVDFQDGPSVTR